MRSSTQRSLKAYEHNLRRAQREQEIAEVANKEQQLVSAHLEEFPPSQPQQASPPTQVDRGAVLEDFRKRALSGIPWYKWSERHAAKRTAAPQAEQAIQEEAYCCHYCYQSTRYKKVDNR